LFATVYILAAILMGTVTRGKPVPEVTLCLSVGLPSPKLIDATYDNLDQLDVASGLFGDRDYNVNRNGNRTQLVADGEITVTTYPKNSSRKRKNKPSSDTFWTCTHDANGSITAKNSTVGAPDLGYEYDARNRLIRATSDDGAVTILGEYAYNGLGQRVGKASDGEVLAYRYGLAGELLAILDDSGQVIREVVYLNGQPLAVVDHEADAVYYVHNDHLGTPRALSDESGARVWTAVYDPFGAATVDEDPDQDGISVTLNLRFPGQYYDQETGLHYNYFRTYDPSTGRYLESDPIGLEGGLNTYGYAYQNPLTYTDPMGLDPATATATAQAALYCTGPQAAACAGGAAVAAVGLTSAYAGTKFYDAFAPQILDGIDAVVQACTTDEAEAKKKKGCEALRQSVLKTCAGLKGRKMFDCFQAAQDTYDACMSQD